MRNAGDTPKSESEFRLRRPSPTPAQIPGLANVEWPTLAVALICYLGFGAVTWHADLLGPVGTVFLLAPLIALHSSLQHEILHGHPFALRRANAALAFPALGFFVPFERFRDTHLAHHSDPALTDPYDDPESNYLDHAAWVRSPGLLRALLVFNNTLLGRMAVGPAIGLTVFFARDLRLAVGAKRSVILRLARAYGLHAGGVGLVAVWLIAFTPVSPAAYVASCYLALSLLKIRTFLEHQACERAGGRSVIIEDRGPLSWLFLNNNLHAVHHARPALPWYELPGYYRSKKAKFLAHNGNYRYRSYGDIFRRYLVTAKDPVWHPLRPSPPLAGWTAVPGCVSSSQTGLINQLIVNGNAAAPGKA